MRRGSLASWSAGSGFDLIGDLIVGIIGASIGDRLLPRLGTIEERIRRLDSDDRRSMREAGTTPLMEIAVKDGSTPPVAAAF